MFSQNFSSAGKGQFTASKAKHMRQRYIFLGRGGGGGEGIPSLLNAYTPQIDILVTALLNTMNTSCCYKYMTSHIQHERGKEA